MSLETPNLVLPLLAAAQAQKHVTHNEALLILDSLTQLAVIGQCANPPAAPPLGGRYLVASPGGGAFSTHEGSIASLEEGGWRFMTPRAGWLTYVADKNCLLLFDGANWKPAPLDRLEMLGVNIDANAANRLSVSSPAVLFNHAGDDIRLTLNKESGSRTASVIYQSGWSGRAEIGLAGDENLHVKTSPDGSNWRESMIFDRANGGVSFPYGVKGGDRSSFRNLLCNSSFFFNQRNVSGIVSLTPGAYGHDGLKAGANGATYTFAQTGVDAMLTVSAGSLIMPVEGNLMEGGVYTLAHDGTAQARVWQGTGVNGLGSYAGAARETGGLAITGLAANTQTNVEYSKGTILRPQLEIGKTATMLERVHPSFERLRCMRYFEQIYITEIIGTSFFSSSILIKGVFKTVKPFVPTFNLKKTTYTTYDLFLNGAWVNAGNVTLGAINADVYGWNGLLSGFSGLPNGVVFPYASSLFVTVSAEL